VAAPLSEILAELERTLDPGRFTDYAVNGLQVPGPETIERIATGVSANLAMFERAAAERADLVLVHHGLFWGDGVRAIDDALHRRLRILFRTPMALAAEHLPLDAHPALGNNALLARAVGGEGLEPFALHHGESIGFVTGLGDEGVEVAELMGRVGRATEREAQLLGAGPAKVRRLAIVSGGGADYLQDALAAGADGLLTGEVSERSPAIAAEAGLHLIAAGHHATETLGIRALGEHLSERLAVEHVFIDVPNPV
jgi:dinuclear metal center YbgI/SA1388 family protein